MGFSESAALAKAEPFRERVRCAVVKSAIAIMAEEPSGLGAKDEKRGILATRILQDAAASLLDAFCYAVVHNVAIDANSPDNDIEFTVNSVFDAIAGVVGKERS